MSRRNVKKGKIRPVANAACWVLLSDGRVLVDDDQIVATARAAFEPVDQHGGYLVAAAIVYARFCADSMAKQAEQTLRGVAREDARKYLTGAGDAMARHMVSAEAAGMIAVTMARIRTAIDNGDTEDLDRMGLAHVARIPMARGPKGES